jgi:hypothetical protein
MLYTKSELTALHFAFDSAYPEYSNQLKACKNEQQLLKAYKKIKLDALEKAKPYLAEGDDPTGFPSIALTPQQYNSFKSASGGNIKVYVTAMLSTAQIVKPDFSVGRTTAELLGGGITAIGTIAGAAFGEGMVGGAVAAVAVAAGVEAVTVAGLVSLIAVAIVAIIIPILYFMLKPACCFVLVMNETGKDLNWVDDHNVHGKPIGHTPSIPKSINIPPPIPGSGTYVYAGLVQTDKHDNALVGTQYGFTYSDGSNNINFGTECPLTSIYVDNNCFCEIGSTSANAADQTDSKDVQSYTASGSGLNASIKCNSKSGYVAYYIAQVSDGSLELK